MTAVAPGQEHMMFSHMKCQDCEVEWLAASSLVCWCCGKQGTNTFAMRMTSQWNALTVTAQRIMDELGPDHHYTEAVTP